jgi:predicted RNA binding protein YcfA (HicA-like mRNA interferase family)
MPNLRRMSAREVLTAFQALGFVVHSQRGSHVKLRRLGPGQESQTLTIPNHHEIDTGTLRAIIRQASRYIAADELHSRFYR